MMIRESVQITTDLIQFDQCWQRDNTWGWNMSRPRAADDFRMIRSRMLGLRRACDQRLAD
jgi:hypothetical protein